MPKKRFGQHFLTDPAIVGKIVRLSGVGPGDTVVEVGAGRGDLTRALAATAGQVIAIEIDRDLVPDLRRTLPANVRLIEADALALPFAELSRDAFHLVANLPYNIATPLLARFVRVRARIVAATIMVQKEVADRILASPGTAAYSPLSFGIQYYANVERGFVVAPGSFRPPPRVQSRVIRLTWKDGVADAPDLVAFVGRAFASRRKKLVNNLAAMRPGSSREALARVLIECGIDADARPENVSVEEFARLHERLDPAGPENN